MYETRAASESKQSHPKLYIVVGYISVAYVFAPKNLFRSSISHYVALHPNTDEKIKRTQIP